MDRASLGYRIWHESAVPVFLERFVLTVLAAVVVTIIMLNPFKFDWDQQAALFIAVAAFAYFVATTVHRTKPLEPKATQTDDAQNTRASGLVPPVSPGGSPAESEKQIDKAKDTPPAIKQRTEGPNSPSVVTTGPNSPVVINQQPIMPPMVEGLSVATRQVPSTRPDAPYAIEATVQVQADISPFGVGFVCDHSIVSGEFSMPNATGMNMFMMLTTGELTEAKGRSYFVQFGSPPMTPRSPLVMVLFGTAPFRITKVVRIR